MKNYWITRLHTVLGITAGLVLCAVGVTGALQSFEEDLLHRLNPAVFERAEGSVLSLSEQMEQARSAHPDKRIASWQTYSAPGYPARVGFADKVQPGSPERGDAANSAAKAPRPRTEFRYLNTSTGELYPPLRGEEFFRAVNDIHRRLAAGETGKQIVGASVLSLVVLCLSGLYLRWPHNPLNWRNWFKLDFKLRGRRFLRDLHMTSATWLLLLYLLSALTGLSWSYDWYKNSLYALARTTPPVRELKLEKPAHGAADIEKLWQAFLRESGGRFREATLRFPERADAFEIRYLDTDAAHNRAFNRLFLNPADAVVIAHERHVAKPAGARFMVALFPLHTGSLFGLPGRLAMMLAALLMPLFAVTGWKMYLDRHRREHAAKQKRPALQG